MWRHYTEEQAAEMLHRGHTPREETHAMSANDTMKVDLLAVAKQVAAQRGITVAEADDWIRRQVDRPAPIEAPAEMDPRRLAKTIAYQKGISLAEAQRIAIGIVDGTHAAKMKDAIVAERDARLRATDTGFAAEEVAEQYAAATVKANDRNAPGNVVASQVASRLMTDHGLPRSQADKLAIAATNKARGLPLVPPSRAFGGLTRDPYAAEKQTARDLAVELSAKSLSRPAIVATVAMRLEREGCTHTTAMALAANAADEVSR